MKTTRGLALLALLAAPLSAQQDSVDIVIYDRADMKVIATPESYRGDRGDTLTFTAVVIDIPTGDTLDVAVTWSADNPNAVVIDAVTGFATFMTRGRHQVFGTPVGATPPLPPLPPSDATFVFNSDWSTELGTSDAAIRDTGNPFPWGVSKSQGGNFEVVSAAGLGFPPSLQNVTSVINLGASQSPASPVAGVRIEAGTCTQCLPIPEIGGSLFYRWYLNVVVPDNLPAGSDQSNHIIQDGAGGTGGINWELLVEGRQNGTWFPRLMAVSDGRGQESFYVLGNSIPPVGDIPLSKNTVYMFELQWLRDGLDTFQFHVKLWEVRNGVEVLIHTDQDWHILNRNMTTTLADGVSLNMGTLAMIEGLNWGSNGWSPPDSASAYTAWHKGGVAVCVNDWCGPHNGS